MNKNIPVEVDLERCTGCGMCIKVCPQRSISLVKGKAEITGKTSFSCGHCEAACPQKAIRVQPLDDEMGSYQTFTAHNEWLPFGKFDIVGLHQLMASRRSCRNYTEQPVDRSILQDLVKIAVTAPTGTNSQQWTFTVIPSRKAVSVLAVHIGAYFKRLNRWAAIPFIRIMLKLIGKGELDLYYRHHYESVQKALEEWEREGKDSLFHGASAVIIVGSKPDASCPMEDALLATQNILLAAHSMGLGSCLIGFAVAAMKRDRTIQLAIGIPAQESVYTVITLGYPDEAYHTVIRRKKVVFRYYE